MKVIENMEEVKPNSLVIVGSDSCVACKQIASAIDNTPSISEASYIDISNAYNFLNKLAKKARSLPVILFFGNDKEIKEVLIGNVSMNKIKGAYNA